MRLELAAYPVEELRLGAATRWRDGVLEIDAREILELVRRDPLVERAELDVARPGESVRIVTIQNRRAARQGGKQGRRLSGHRGPSRGDGGDGRTNRLAGFTPDATARRRRTCRQYGLLSSFRPGTAYGDFLDMSGPGAISPWRARSISVS